MCKQDFVQKAKAKLQINWSQSEASVHLKKKFRSSRLDRVEWLTISVIGKLPSCKSQPTDLWPCGKLHTICEIKCHEYFIRVLKISSRTAELKTQPLIRSPFLPQTFMNSPPQRAERLICLRESNTKLGPLSAPSCLGNHSEISRLSCTEASSMVALFTTGWSCNPCHLPIVLPAIPLEKEHPRNCSPHVYTHTHTHPAMCVTVNSRVTVTMAISIVIISVPPARQQVSSMLHDANLSHTDDDMCVWHITLTVNSQP